MQYLLLTLQIKSFLAGIRFYFYGTFCKPLTCILIFFILLLIIISIFGSSFSYTFLDYLIFSFSCIFVYMYIIHLVSKHSTLQYFSFYDVCSSPRIGVSCVYYLFSSTLGTAIFYNSIFILLSLQYHQYNYIITANEY